MFDRLQNFVKENNKDIILGAGIALMVIISIGIGRLSADAPAEVMIENASRTTAGAVLDMFDQTKAGTANENAQFVASVNGEVYHAKNSPWAERIKEENRLFFNTEEEAQAAGYRRSNDFEKYAP